MSLVSLLRLQFLVVETEITEILNDRNFIEPNPWFDYGCDFRTNSAILVLSVA